MLSFHNPELHGLVMEWLKEALPGLQKSPNGALSVSLGATELLLKLPSGLKCLDALHKDKKINGQLEGIVRSFWMQIPISDIQVFSILLLSYITKEPSAQFREEVFDALYQKIEDFFYSDKIEVRLTAILVNFVSEVNNVKFDEGFELIRNTPKEIDEARSRFASSKGWVWFTTRCQYSLRRTWKVPKIIQTPKIETKQPDIKFIKAIYSEFENFLPLLWMVKQGGKGVRMLPIKHEVFPLSFLATSFSGVAPTFKPFDTYSLGSGDVPILKSLWRSHKALMKKKSRRAEAIQTSIRRFSYGCFRERQEDRLIDYFISFETLLLYSLKRSYKTGNILGYIISELFPEENPDKLRDLFKGAWEVRNKMVHGGDYSEVLKGLDKTQEELADQIENYLRNCINKFLAETNQEELANQIEKHLWSFIKNDFLVETNREMKKN